MGLLDCSRRLNLTLNTVKRLPASPSRPPTASPHATGPPFRPLPRPSASTPVPQPGSPPHLPLARDQRTGTSRQPQPPGPLPQPGPLRRRPSRDNSPPPRPPPAHHPERLWTKDTNLLGLLIAACPEMTPLAQLTGQFAILQHRPDSAAPQRPDDGVVTRTREHHATDARPSRIRSPPHRILLQ